MELSRKFIKISARDVQIWTDSMKYLKPRIELGDFVIINVIDIADNINDITPKLRWAGINQIVGLIVKLELSHMACKHLKILKYVSYVTIIVEIIF